MRRAGGLLAALLAIAVAGCGGGSSGTTTRDLAELAFERSGGIDGITEQWILSEDGSLINLAVDVVETLDAVDAAALFAAIDDAGFFDLDPAYLPDDPCCDRFAYKLTVVQDGRRHTVQTMDGADAPGELLDLVGAILALVGG